MEQINNNSISSELVDNNRLRVAAAEIEAQLTAAIAELQLIKTNTSRISQFQFQLAEDSTGTVFVSRYNNATGTVEALTLTGGAFNPVGEYNIVSSGGGGVEIETNEFVAIQAGVGWQAGDVLTRTRFIDTASRTVVQIAWYGATGTVISTVPVIGTDVIDSDRDMLQKLAKLADAIVYDGGEARLRTFDVGLSDEVGSISDLWTSAISNAIRNVNPQYRLVTNINLAIATPNQKLYAIDSLAENCKTFLIHSTGFVENLEIFAHESPIYDNSMAFGVPYYSLVGNQSVNSSFQFTSDPDWIILNCPSRYLFIRTDSDFSVSPLINNKSLFIYAVDESLYSNGLLGFLAENSKQSLTKTIFAETQRSIIAQSVENILSNLENTLSTVTKPATRGSVVPFIFSNTSQVFEQLGIENYGTFCVHVTGVFSGVILRSYQKIIAGNEIETRIYSVTEQKWVNFIDRTGIYLVPIYGHELRFKLQQITLGQVEFQGYLTADRTIEPKDLDIDSSLQTLISPLLKISSSVYYDDSQFDIEPSLDGSIIGGTKDCSAYKKAIIYIESKPINENIYVQIDGVITRVNIRNIGASENYERETDVIGYLGTFNPALLNVYDCDLYGSTFNLLTDAQDGEIFVGRVVFTNSSKGEHVDIVESKITLREIYKLLANEITKESKGKYAKGYEIAINNDVPEIFIPANANRIQLDIQNTGKRDLNIYLLPTNIGANPITNDYKCAVIKPDGSYTTNCFVGSVAINAGTDFDNANCLAHEISSEMIL